MAGEQPAAVDGDPRGFLRLASWMVRGIEAAFVTHSSGLNLALFVVGSVFMAVSQDQLQ